MARLSILLFVIFAVYCVHGSDVASKDVLCPNPAANCLTERFNSKVIPALGCIGCQDGCKAGYVKTENNRYYNKTASVTDTYIYQTISISGTVNIYEPEWICVLGSSCRPGYYPGTFDNKFCQWCGEGCNKCFKFDSCQGCFGGYTKFSVSLFGKTKTTCKHSKIKCPVQPTDCDYEVYVSKGSGCIGCQLCKPGYTVTYNPKYFKKNTSSTSPTYDYMGLQIRDGVDINEPRYICHKGTTCKSGFYARKAGTVTVCEWCGEHCTSCSGKNTCTACEITHVLSNTTNSCELNLIG